MELAPTTRTSSSRRAHIYHVFNDFTNAITAPFVEDKHAGALLVTLCFLLLPFLRQLVPFLGDDPVVFGARDGGLSAYAFPCSSACLLIFIVIFGAEFANYVISCSADADPCMVMGAR